MKTAPEAMLAGSLVIFGAIFGMYLLSTVKPQTHSSPSIPTAIPTSVTCKLGQLLTQSTCQDVKTGNVDFKLNAGDRFSVPGSEYIRIVINSGRIRTNHLSTDYVGYYNVGEAIMVDRLVIITATENNTSLSKRLN